MTYCPICAGKYSRVDLSEDVCDQHQNWFVITCESCGKVKFSSSVGICGKCGYESFHPMTQGSGNHRAILAQYGLENFEG